MLFFSSNLVAGGSYWKFWDQLVDNASTLSLPPFAGSLLGIDKIPVPVRASSLLVVQNATILSTIEGPRQMPLQQPEPPPRFWKFSNSKTRPDLNTHRLTAISRTILRHVHQCTARGLCGQRAYRVARGGVLNLHLPQLSHLSTSIHGHGSRYCTWRTSNQYPAPSPICLLFGRGGRTTDVVTGGPVGSGIRSDETVVPTSPRGPTR